MEVKNQSLNKGKFEELLENSLKSIEEGQIIQGRVLKVTPKEVFIDIGAKSEGVCPIFEFKNPEELKQGAKVNIYVENVDTDDGFTLLSKQKADFLLIWDKIKEVCDRNETITGKVLRKVKGGLIVDVLDIDAFLPGSHIDVKLVKNFSNWVGKEIPLKILKLNKQRKNVVVSRKAAIEEEIEQKKEKLKTKFKTNDVVEGEVKALTNFGAFLKVDDIDGFIHIADLSHRKIKHPKEVLKIGDKIKAKVISVDVENLRLSLSLKELLPSIWEKIDEKYPIGKRVKGRVKKILNSGILVELEPEIVGFVHITEMSWKKSLQNPKELVRENEIVECIVLDIDKEKERISLGMKQTQPDPWSLVEEKYPVGTIVKGKVTGFDNFGAFVEIEEGIEGYLHVSDISWTRRFQSPQETMRYSQKLRVKITEIDKKNRFISVSLKHLRPNPWEELKKKLTKDVVLKATISEVTKRGIVVKVAEGLEGFVPSSHLLKQGEIEKVYKIGEELSLKVLNLESQRKRVLLSEKEYEKAVEKQEMEKFIKKTEETTKVTLGEILKGELEKLFNIEEREEDEDKIREK